MIDRQQRHRVTAFCDVCRAVLASAEGEWIGHANDAPQLLTVAKECKALNADGWEFADGSKLALVCEWCRSSLAMLAGRSTPQSEATE